MSNLTKRIIAGVFGIPLIIAACYFGGIYFLIFSILVSSLALRELFIMFGEKNISPPEIPGIIISVLIIICGYIETDLFIILPAAIIMIFISEIFRKEKNPFNPAAMIFGLIYITIPFVMLNYLLKYVNQDFDINIVIYIFILIWVCDTAAYFGGRTFGKHKLSELSPKKTWEGAIAGFIMTVVVSVVIHYFFSEKITLTDATAFGIITGIFSQIGDLFESMIKRYCGVKDSSDLIPGHGGILDRFDSLIFVTPVIFIYLNV